MNSSDVKIDKYLYKFIELSNIPNNLRDHRCIIKLLHNSSIAMEFIKKEIIFLIVKHIKEDILNMGNDIFVDIRTNTESCDKLITDIILKHKRKSAIANGAICNLLQDSSFFNYDYVSNFNNSPIYLVGDISQTNIYTDSNMQFDDDIIILFDEILLNIQNIHIHTQTTNLMIDEYIINYQFDFHVENPNVLYIIKSTESESYLKFKSKRRDARIDELLK